MPVEDATFIADLVATNPEVTDPIAEGAPQIRLVKQVLQNQFTALADVAVTATAVDLNTTTGLVDNTAGTLTAPIPTGSTTVGGSVVLKGAGGNADVILSNVEGGLSVISGSQLCILMDPVGNTAFNGLVNASSLEQLGLALLPSGIIMKWHGSAATIPANYVLCDGTNGTPDMRDSFVVGAGNTYTPGQTGGALTATSTSSTDGSHSHGGATASGGGQTLHSSSDTQGAHQHGGASLGYTLTVNDIPGHTHQQILFGAGGLVSSNSPPGGGAGGGSATTATQSTGGGGSHSHAILVDGSHSHNIAVDAVNAHTHGVSTDGSHNHTTTVSTVPPFYALCYIMKV